MKRFLKKRFLGIPMLAILMVALAGVTALAAITINIRSNDVNVPVGEDPTPVYSILLDSVAGPVYFGQPFDVSGTLSSPNGGNVVGVTIRLYRGLNDYAGQPFDVITTSGGAFTGVLYAYDTVGELTDSTHMVIHAEAPVQPDP